MLHHIVVDCKMHGLLFQASIFHTFQRILSSPMPSPEEKEFSRLARFVLSKFFLIASKNSKVFVELLFWKKPQEAIELEEGYEKQAKIRGPSNQCWTEEEIGELQTLYEEYQEHNGIIDKGVIDYIMNHLTNQLKTRKQVIRQLKQQNLIESFQHLPKAKTKHRQKARKATTSEDFLEDPENNENFLEGDTIEQNDHIKKVAAVKTQQNRKKSKKKETQQQQFQEPELPSTVSSFDTEEKLNCIRNEILLAEKRCITFYKEGVMWLKESLQEAAEDEEDDDLEATPIVPITNEHHTLMENDEFLKLMKTLGFVPPATEQETFWRIPVHLTVEQLNVRAEMLDSSLKGQLDNTENVSTLDSVNSLKENETEVNEEEVVLSHVPVIGNGDNEDTSSDDEQPKKRIKIRCIESDED